MFLALADCDQDGHFGKSFCGGGIFKNFYLSFFVIVVVVVVVSVLLGNATVFLVH